MYALHTVDGSVFHRLSLLAPNEAVFVVANLIIVLGYATVAVRVVPLLPVKMLTRVSGLLFFLLCAATHFEQAVHTLYTSDWTWERLVSPGGDWLSAYHMNLIHVPQAFVVWLFLMGFYFDLRALRAERGTSGPAMVAGDDDRP